MDMNRHTFIANATVSSVVRLTVQLLAVAWCPGGPLALAAEDPAWHFPEATGRVLARVWATDAETPVQRPAKIRCDGLSGSGVRAWDLDAGREVAVQRLGQDLLLDLGRPIQSAKPARCLLYDCPSPVKSSLAARLDDAGRIETDRYVARMDRDGGGILKSLALKVEGQSIETLGDGVTWWIGRQPQVKPQSFGRLAIEPTAAGPVFLGLRVVYPKVLADENQLVVDYRFLRDFVEVDYTYRAARPVDLTWLKIPVSLAATGDRPGLASGSRTPQRAMLTAGKANTWTLDRTWHDVSYLGPQGFGLGVIARNVMGGLYYMDSVQAGEHEWIYAEPYGFQNAVRIESDFSVQLTIVPHPAGDGRYRDTVAKCDGAVGSSTSLLQKNGDSPIDSDGDGLPDLDEWAAGTNPNCPDTDGDGLVDGRDPDPLRGASPVVRLELPSYQAASTSQPQTIAQVKPVGGVPTIVLDGKPYGPMTYTRCAATWEQLAEIGDRGFPLQFEMVGDVGWPDRQEEVFRRLDDHMHEFLRRVPNTRVVLRLYVCKPPHFVRDYPDEVLRFNDGSKEHFSQWYAVKDLSAADRGYPSFASAVWRRGTAEALYRYVTHVRQSDYARNVIGYFVCGGGTEEWYYWGDYDHAKYCCDFSPAMLRAFREHLRVKYGGDVTRLREAWHDANADFGTALPPNPTDREAGASGAFWNEALMNRMRDYYYVHNKVIEDSLLIFAHAVKQACRDEQLVGMFHGYLQNHWFLEGGQATLTDLLGSPDVDFWSGPPQYDRRGHGEHACNRFPGASLKAHGKLWISESDMRTCFSEHSPGNPSLYGRTPNIEESLAILQREYAHQLCEGNNGWWFQMGKTWYHHEPILSLFHAMQRAGEAAVAFDRTSDTDIAAVVDLESLLNSPPWPVSSSLLDAFKVQETCRIGSPVDYYLLDDVLAASAKPYKLYLMLNCFGLSDARRRLIDQRLRQRGAVIVWMYAPGLFNPDHTPERDSAHTRDLLGFELQSRVGPPAAPNMRLTADGAAWLSGFDPKRVFGSIERPRWEGDHSTGQFRRAPAAPTRLAERFFAAESPALGDAKVLARFCEGNEPAIVVRHTNKATDLWIGSVMAPADLLRSIARRAGCHLFCDADEIVYANHSFLAIHTAVAGTREFRLRRPTDVVEVFSGQSLGKGVSRFNDTIPAFRTRVYFLGSAERWQAESSRAEAWLKRFVEQMQADRKK
jgi:hypothetical protein